MKAISLWQPWASLIIEGLKEYETRSWSHNYRGYLAIHAAKRWNKAQVEECQDLLRNFPDELTSFFEKPIPLGAILGVVHVDDVLRTDTINYRQMSSLEYAVGDYSAGRYAWRMTIFNRAPEPIPAKGAQGFWEWDKKPVGEVSWATIEPPSPPPPKLVQGRLF